MKLVYRFSALAAFALLALGGVGCSSSDEGDERPCRETDAECSCQALSDGWCIMYHNDSGYLEEGQCEDLGGTEVKELCPTDGEVGRCHEIDDCHDPTYIFYADYDGGFEDYASVGDLEAACNQGELVGSTCAEWLEP